MLKLALIKNKGLTGGHDMAINWIKLFKDYKGQWVALKDDEKTVIVAGINPKTVRDTARKKGFEHPILMKVPAKLIPYIGSQHAPFNNRSPKI